MPTTPASPLVTVGMPIHNGEAFVAEAIESVLGQQAVTLELVISDNASTDRTEEICREYAAADSRVRYVRSGDNRGAAWNFNNVVELAEGTYFKWAAHDDVCGPRFVQRCVAVLEEHADVVLAYPRVIDIDGQGDRVFTRPSYSYATAQAPSDRARDVLRNPSPCFEVFGVMRRSQLARTGLIGSYSSSDRTLLFELAMMGRFHELQDSDAILRHREHVERSVHVFPDARARDEWFDPGRAAAAGFPRWRLVGEHLAATRRAQLDAGQRLGTLSAVAAWTGARSPLLARDVAGWVRRKVVAPRAAPRR